MYSTTQTTEMEAILLSDDPCAILNIETNATEAQIITAHRKLMLKYHPDKHQGETNQKLANEVAQKLNMARDTVIDKLKNPENSSVKVKRVRLFANRVLSEVLANIFSSDRHLHLMHDEKSYAFGLSMLWARSVMSKEQKVTLMRIKKALANNTTVIDVINLAQGVHPYIESHGTIDKVRARRHVDVLQTASPMAEFNVFSDENMGWNMELPQCLSLTRKIARAYPSIPIIMHNLSFKSENHTFIGLYYEKGHYYVFNPDHIHFDEHQQGLRALSWQEVEEQLTKALYHTDHAIAETEEIFPTTVSLFTLRAQPLAITHSESFVSSDRPSIGWDCLQQWFNQGQFNAEYILQSIYDGELTGILSRFYKTNPELFPTEILRAHLMKALKNKHKMFAMELCQLDKLVEPPTWKWSKEYINLYIKQGYSLVKLFEVIAVFHETGIDLIPLIDSEVKQNGSTWLDNIDKKIKDADSLRKILQLGIRLTDKQRIILVTHLSDKIYHLAIVMSLCKFADKLEEVEKQRKVITEKTRWLQTLIDFGYHFQIPDGLKNSSYLYRALVKAELFDLANQYCDAGLINLDAKDEDHNTVLNTLIREEKWAEARYLIDKGAPYSMGPQIEANAIPQFVAWREKVELLRDLYEGDKREQLLNMTFKEGDLLAAAAAYASTSGNTNNT